MKTILQSVVIGLVVVVVGLLFAALFGSLCNGFSYESAVVLGMCAFCCFVTVVCTGVVLSQIKRK